jgi:hypothetical protein
LDEDDILLESLFGGKKTAGVKEIKSVAFNDFDVGAEKVNRTKQNVSQRWISILAPILLSFHFGTLHKPWREDFLKYVVKKKIVGIQGLDYSELSRIFPEQNATSLCNVLKRFKDRQTEETKPLFKIVEDNLVTFKDIQETERHQQFREEIVRMYEEVKNR